MLHVLWFMENKAFYSYIVSHVKIKVILYEKIHQKIISFQFDWTKKRKRPWIIFDRLSSSHLYLYSCKYIFAQTLQCFFHLFFKSKVRARINFFSCLIFYDIKSYPLFFLFLYSFKTYFSFFDMSNVVRLD